MPGTPLAQYAGMELAEKVMVSRAQMKGGDVLEEFQKFVKEVSFMVKLKHSNLVSTIAWSRNPDMSMYMEFCSGGSLKDFYLPKKSVLASEQQADQYSLLGWVFGKGL